MTIRYQKWCRFMKIATICIIPAGLFLFLDPQIGRFAQPLRIGAFCIVMLLGLCGGVTAILERRGTLSFHYTEKEKQGRHYRISKEVAELEFGIWGNSFSPRYYENYGVPKRTEVQRDETTDLHKDRSKPKRENSLE